MPFVIAFVFKQTFIEYAQKYFIYGRRSSFTSPFLPLLCYILLIVAPTFGKLFSFQNKFKSWWKSRDETIYVLVIWKHVIDKHFVTKILFHFQSKWNKCVFLWWKIHVTFCLNHSYNLLRIAQNQQKIPLKLK